MAHETLNINITREWASAQAKIESDSGITSVGGLAYRIGEQEQIMKQGDTLNAYGLMYSVKDVFTTRDEAIKAQKGKNNLVAMIWPLDYDDPNTVYLVVERLYHQSDVVRNVPTK